MAKVLITGCNSGFGYYTTEYFAREGHRVFATVRSQEGVDDLEAMAAQEGYSIEILHLDVTDNAEIESVRDRVLADGPLDVLINNAGRVIIAPFEETTEEDIRALFDVNVFGLMNMTRAFLPSMRANRSGTIVNVSSPIGQAPTHWYSLYAASKSAVDAMTKALAQELEDWNIRMILVYPGNFKTSVLKHAFGDLTVSEDSPYYDLKQRTKAQARANYAALLKTDEERAQRETGRPVGEAIYNAVFDGTNNLHYPVGSDAEAVINHMLPG